MKNEQKKDQLQILIKKIIYEELNKSFIKEDYRDDVVYRAFVQPFTDVVDTAKYGLKKVATTTIRSAVKLAKQHAAAFIPFISKTVSQIGNEEKKKLESKLSQLDKEYSDVLKRNWETLRTRDVSFLLFMMDPKIYLGSSLALKAPEVAFDLLDSFIDNKTVSKWHDTFKQLNKKVLPPTSSGTGSGTSGGSGYYDEIGTGWESLQYNTVPVLKESLSKEELDKKAAVTLGRLLKSNNIINQLNKSPKIKELRKAAIEVFIDKAKELSNAQSISDVKTFFGPDFDSYYNKIEKPSEEKNEFDQQLVVELKSIYNKMLMTYFENIKRQIPESSDEINKAISFLETL